jgi:mono/diheme cytochrome c family protein
VSAAVAGCAILALAAAIAAQPAGRIVDPDGWQIPQAAAEEKNPVPASAEAVEQGRQIYRENCQKCHGPKGKGDGPDGDPDHRPSDLSNASRLAPTLNPDGVIFYKVWNGRKQPRMPAHKDRLTRQQVWTLIHYVRTLSQPPAP